MKILLLAQINSIFTYELVTNILQNNNEHKFDIFSSIPAKNIEKYNPIFDNIYSPKHPFHNIRILKTILNVISFFKFIISSKKKYDVVHVLFVDYLTYFNVFFFKIISKKTIITIYGSDYYKLNKIQKILFFNSLKKANVISCTNNDIPKKISKYSDKFNIKTVRFGLTPLVYIDEIYKDKKELIFNELENKFIISCGYNGYKNNNHIKVIEALNKIKEKLPDNYLIVFQITYGVKYKYIQQIKTLLKLYALKSIFIEDFLSYEKLASLRLRTKIAILPLSTDSFSGTVQEYLFAKSILITGSWLPYNLLKEKNAYFETINNFEELPNKIIYCIENYDLLKKKTPINKDIIWELSSWESNIKHWLKLYK